MGRIFPGVCCLHQAENDQINTSHQGEAAMAVMDTYAVVGTDAPDYLTGTSQADLIDGGDGNDTLFGDTGDDTLLGSYGADALYGYDGNDLLLGGRKDDRLDGGAGNDTLDGGLGDDTLHGGDGSDVFVLSAHTGRDAVEFFTNPDANSSVDSIRLASGLDVSQVVMLRRRDWVDVRLLGSGDLIHMYMVDTAPDEAVLVEDERGGVLTYGQARAMPDMSQAQVLTLTSPGGTLVGGAGADILSAGGQTGATLDGGAGPDILSGNPDTTFLFGAGDGQDFLSYGGAAPNRATVAFKDGLTLDDLDWLKSDSGLRVVIKGTTDELQLGNIGGLSSTTDVTSDLPSRFVFTYGNDRTILLASQAASLFRWVGSEEQQTLLGGAGNDVLNGGASDDGILGRGGNDTLLGGEGQDQLSGEDGDDVLKGGDQADILWGGAGNDTLDGGSGQDSLWGDVGADVYLVQKGSGLTQITGDGLDVIRFEPGISPEDIHFDAPYTFYSTHQGYDESLTLSWGVSGDEVKVNAPGHIHKPGATWGFDRIEFADGTVWSQQDVADALGRATPGNDRLSGLGDHNDLWSGLNGQDTLYGGDGNDDLSGGAGNDYVRGGFGNDTLSGGPGNDMLSDESGDDFYVFRKGDGQDQIFDVGVMLAASSPLVDPEHDVLSLPDYRPADLLRVSESNDGMWHTTFRLEFDGGDHVDRISISDQRPVVFTDFNTVRVREGVDEIRFGDGTVWRRPEIETSLSTLLATPTDGADRILGQLKKANVLQGLGGQDLLLGGDLDDILDGGQGRDTLRGGAGNDTYRVSEAFDPQTQAWALDQVIEFGDEGVDTVYADVSTYALSANVDNLVMGGKGGGGDAGAMLRSKAATFHGLGNDLNNLLTGDQSKEWFEGLGGDDTLEGMGGNDSLDGGVGNDLLIGGLGNDAYIWGAGSGEDVLVDDEGSQDRLQLSPGLVVDQVWLSRVGADLRITLTSQSDSLTVRGWFAGEAHQVERITLGNRQLDAANVDALVNAMAQVSPPASATAALPSDLKALVEASWAVAVPG
jgi:trimeric autotransporter adhesin